MSEIDKGREKEEKKKPKNLREVVDDKQSLIKQGFTVDFYKDLKLCYDFLKRVTF